MSDTSSSPSQESERNLPPGHSWLEIIKRRTPEAFAAAFTKDVVLNASVLPRPISGAADLTAAQHVVMGQSAGVTTAMAVALVVLGHLPGCAPAPI
jgi:hypothetical protein